jgi:hypothetical protein
MFRVPLYRHTGGEAQGDCFYVPAVASAGTTAQRASPVGIETSGIVCRYTGRVRQVGQLPEKKAACRAWLGTFSVLFKYVKGRAPKRGCARSSNKEEERIEKTE